MQMVRKFMSSQWRITIHFNLSGNWLLTKNGVWTDSATFFSIFSVLKSFQHIALLMSQILLFKSLPMEIKYDVLYESKDLI